MDADEKGKSLDIKKYIGMIGFLLYLTTSRSDIMFSVCLCACFQSNPKKSHLSRSVHTKLKESLCNGGSMESKICEGYDHGF